MSHRFICILALLVPAVAACSGNDTPSDGEVISQDIQAGSADLRTAQTTLDKFVIEHEASSTKTYCRVDVPTPECRSLVEFKNKATQKSVPVFMTSFTAPFRQAGGVEFLFPAPDGAPNAYTRYGDKQMNGKVEVEETSPQVVERASGKLAVKQLKFGALVADLSFDDAESVLDGETPSATDPSTMQKVRIVYKRFRAQ